jgi:hypothetical protein
MHRFALAEIIRCAFRSSQDQHQIPEQLMNLPSAESVMELTLSQPTVADGEIQFSAFRPGWGFCSYVLPAGVAVQRLGAKDLSSAQLHLAFQLNRQRIAAAVAAQGARDASRPVILSTV